MSLLARERDDYFYKHFVNFKDSLFIKAGIKSDEEFDGKKEFLWFEVKALQISRGT